MNNADTYEYYFEDPEYDWSKVSGMSSGGTSTGESNTGGSNTGGSTT